MSTAARPHFDWRLRTRVLPLGRRTLVMGVVNVTPDSFSDGGASASTASAVDHGLRLLDDGADILDVGGESTRPGAPAGTTEAISAAQEQARVLPVIAGILRSRPEAVVSVDSYRASTARAAVNAGAEIVNDVSGGLWDEAMFAACTGLGCGVIVMHTRGLPSEWAAQRRLEQDEVMPVVLDGLRERLEAALRSGMERSRIVLDPGFGFGKLRAENWALLRGFSQLHQLGQPLMAGLSRKGFLSANDPAAQRDDLTHIADTFAIAAGAHLVRVHDVQGAVRAARIADAFLNCGREAATTDCSVLPN